MRASGHSQSPGPRRGSTAEVKRGDDHDEMRKLHKKSEGNQAIVREHTLHTPISAQTRGGRYMEGEPAARARTCVALASTLGASRSLVFMTFWSAWVLLIGSRPCALSSLWWR